MKNNLIKITNNQFSLTLYYKLKQKTFTTPLGSFSKTKTDTFGRVVAQNKYLHTLSKTLQSLVPNSPLISENLIFGRNTFFFHQAANASKLTAKSGHKEQSTTPISTHFIEGILDGQTGKKREDRETSIKIDNKIIPLFSNPIYLKEIELEKRNKSNLNSFIRIRNNGFLEQKKTNTLINIQRVSEDFVSKENLSTLSPLTAPSLVKEGKKGSGGTTSNKATTLYYDSLHIRKLFFKGLSLYAKRIGLFSQSNGPYNAVLTLQSPITASSDSTPPSMRDFEAYAPLSSEPSGPFIEPKGVTGQTIGRSEVELKEQNNKENLFKKSKSVINLYLKEISKFNMTRKGLFIHYYEFLGYNFNKQNNKFFSFIERNKNIYKLLAASFKSMYCLISKPVIISTPDKVIIQLFYFLFIPNILKLKKFYKHNYSSLHSPSYGKARAGSAPHLSFPSLGRRGRTDLSNQYAEAIGSSVETGKIKRLDSIGSSNSTILKAKLRKRKNLKRQYSKFRKIKLNVRIKLRNLSNMALTKVFSNRFRILCVNLNKLFKKPVELDLIRLHYPYSDSNILVNLLGIMINKIKLRIIFRKLFLKAVIKNKFIFNSKKVNIIPAFLSGLSIRVGGRLLTHKLVPRKTVKSIRRGATADGKINFKDVATYTNKNKRGAFTITVKSGHNLYN